jgi:aminoglycoside phosphotransferase (APT) family kinase protein
VNEATCSWPEAVADLAPDIGAACVAAFGGGVRIRSVEPSAQGHSGFTYFLRLEPPGGDDVTAVLRVPPPGARPIGPADILRQGRIMAALYRAGLPAPAVLAAVPAAATASGRPFLIVEMVRGVGIEEASQTTPDADLAAAAVDALRAIWRLPVEESGLVGEEPVVPLAEIDRWERLVERSPAELVVDAASLARSLRSARPAVRPPVLVHGDYHYGNLLFNQGRVVAILDWEIAELGQPLMDLAALCLVPLRRRFHNPVNPGGAVDVDSTALLELAQVSADEACWYLAVTCYKYAGILGYNLGLHRRGRRVDPVYETLEPTITGLLELGRELIS